MRTTKTTKAETARQNRFHKLACELIEAAGAGRDPRGGEREYLLDTPVGPLKIHVLDDWIHTRFVSSKGGQAAVGCGHTGKWNFHKPSGLDWVAVLVDWFRRELAHMLAYVPTAAVLRDVKLDLCEDRCQRIKWAQS